MRNLIRLLVPLLAATALHAQTLSNLSVLVTLPPGGTQYAGFIVPGTPTAVYGVLSPGGQPVGPAANETPTVLLVRVVGPTLQSFGIPNPAPSPKMAIFNPAGISLFFGYPGGAPTYGVDFPAIFAAAGAFPLTGGETAGTAYNYGAFYPGVYNVKITDTSGKGGTVLFEVYVLTGAAAANAPLVMTPT